VANFGNVTMTNCTAIINDEIGPLGYFTSIRLSMYNMNGTKLADISNYSNNGLSFTVTYLTSG
jgi:hypothetical protein